MNTFKTILSIAIILVCVILFFNINEVTIAEPINSLSIRQQESQTQIGGEHTVTIEIRPDDAAGSVDYFPYKATYNDYEHVNFTATANPGWVFDYFQFLPSGFHTEENPVDFEMPSSDVDIIVFVYFEEEEYTITVEVSPEGAGSVIVNPDQPTYEPGEIITFTAIANPGWSFSYFQSFPTGYGGPNNPFIFGMETNDETITAYFIEDSFYNFLPLVLK